MKQRVIHVGIGVFGRRWCSEFLKTNVADGTIEVVAIVDLNPEALAFGAAQLGLPAERCYQDAAKAFAEVKADFCTVVVTPAHHEAIIDLALAHGLDILCEKPIADTMAASLRIARKVEAAGRKMAVTMSHRFDQDKTTLRRIVRSGILGKINHVSLRFLGDMRQHMAWSSLFRHQMADPLLIEGAIHHLDIIADFAGAPCRTVYANTWKPSWAEYAGDTDGIVTMEFENGVRALYEGSCAHSTGLNTFYKEYIRVDGEHGSAILHHRDVEVFMRQDIWRQQSREGTGQKVPLLEQRKWINNWLIELFCQWRDGGPALETQVAANVQASALVFGAIESSRSGKVVELQELLAQAA
ncbi:Gfo/Idh/MocA family oxidoreductase [Bosea sp. BK604]|uniref:Gfo/Idh/MocA family protein n=1 Tax=Bosea sp. BK604 TaxID=2512180 RepID=UPI00104964EE|nr:Gfo/Idh/MocA family oxidoreductase [Bosea sp. BK604]TCR62473.1 putative dehydrogenase [Bosea sp. BK604]